jgi:hypothetical protein
MLRKKPVEAVQFVRKMRGSSQAHLLSARNEQAYVVKFHNNPDSRRILINEWVTSKILVASGIETPQTALVRLTPGFLQLNPNVHLKDGNERKPIEPGVHFGSQYPGDPASTVVYDFLPDSILSQVANLQDFLGALVIDKWLGNTDRRQCVFYRKNVALEASDTKRVRWVASMIDHGQISNGAQWEFPDSPIQGLYGRSLVYREVRSLNDFEPWLDLVSNVTEELIVQSTKSIPAEWVEKDRDALNLSLDRLFQRRNRIPELLKACCENAPNSFPHWSPATVCSLTVQRASKVLPIPNTWETFPFNAHQILGDSKVSSSYGLAPRFVLTA